MPRTFKSFLIGRPLSAEEQHNERLDKKRALAVFSSDALSSVAYATEAILLELVVLGSAAMAWSLPVALAICGLLAILALSYRQTIHEYPNGGGAYIVAKENLGETAGLVAGAALLLDYLLTVSVSATAGIEAITSAFPQLISLRILLCALAIAVIALANLRGLRESGGIFAVPTYAFIFSMLALVAVGLWKAANGSLVPQPLSESIRFEYPAIGLFMVLKAFSAGCTALTGVEAISNGVPAFRKPESHNAIVTLIWMATLLGIMFVGVTVLAHLLHIVPNETETVVSMIARAVFGTGWLYFTVQISTMLILILAANTAFADFPRLSSLLAIDRYLPRQLSTLGDRLVFSNGIIMLAVCATLLIVLFGGDTHALLPLYAVGVFISFTLSQSGMVRHFWRLRPRGWRTGAMINAVGAFTTATVFVVIGVTRFMHGAWIIFILIPMLVMGFRKIHAHYLSLAPQLAATPEDFALATKPLKALALIPVSGLHKGMVRSIRFARSLADEVVAVSVDINPENTRRLLADWERLKPGIDLVMLPSPFRSLSGPLLNYIDARVAEASREELEVVLVVPEFVNARWWHHFLHNQTAAVLRAYLWFKYPELVVTSVRHRLQR